MKHTNVAELKTGLALHSSPHFECLGLVSDTFVPVQITYMVSNLVKSEIRGHVYYMYQASE